MMKKPYVTLSPQNFMIKNKVTRSA